METKWQKRKPPEVEGVEWVRIYDVWDNRKVIGWWPRSTEPANEGPDTLPDGTPLLTEREYRVRRIEQTGKEREDMR